MVKFCRKNVFLLNSPLLKCKRNATKPVCIYGWKFFPQTGLCYRYFSLKQSWIGARSKCQNRAPKNAAGDLASIPDATTNKFVSCLAPSYAWIGGRAGNEPRIIGSGLRIWRLNFLSITFKLGCCGSKIYVADSFSAFHNKNIMFKFASAAATLVTDQV